MMQAPHDFIAHVPPDDRTLGVRLLAPSFLRECAGPDRERRTHLLEWTREVFRPGRERAIRALFAAAGALGVESLPAQSEIDELVPVGARVSNANYFDEVDGAIEALLEKMSPFEVAHARASAAWCRRLAGRLGLGEVQTRFVARCGLLHDVGTLRVAKQGDHAGHALAGERMVRRLSILTPFAGIVRSHHERFDGSGGPDGLRGTEIPLEARIVAVAAGFHDRLSPANGLPSTPEAAMRELTAASGTLYDVTVVAALVELVSR
ncbi:MAG: HD domain-containing protein [Candidatus Eremiobacteraeota bacterium]|nr:HD domain-containing protein [Candidatus Eremiobacteraeota bacterium]